MLNKLQTMWAHTLTDKNIAGLSARVRCSQYPGPSIAVLIVLLHPYWKHGEPGSPISYQLSWPSWKTPWLAAPWSSWNPFSPHQRSGHSNSQFCWNNSFVSLFHITKEKHTAAVTMCSPWNHLQSPLVLNPSLRFIQRSQKHLKTCSCLAKTMLRPNFKGKGNVTHKTQQSSSPLLQNIPHLARW